jgi:membrane-bound metal-dependent hydrolase YbcI (DUF457 family)
MPVTPFHFGPGAAVHSLAPGHVSFLAFCASNALIDVEPLYYMLTGGPPLHRFFHTYIGASLVAINTILLFAMTRRLAPVLALPDIFQWQSLRLAPVTFGAFIGTYSHIVLDSVMHSDIRPFAPFTDANPLLHAMPLDALHWFCVGTGVAGVAVLCVRHLLMRDAAD